MTTVAVTGASGFVGHHVLQALTQREFQIRALVRDSAQLEPQPNLVPVIGRLNQSSALKDLLEGADSVIHLAGATGGFNYSDFAQVNVSGTQSLVNCAQQNCPDIRFIHLSSLAAREPSLSDYGASKLAGEKCVRDSDLNWMIVRPPAVYGPHDKALAPLWRALARGWLIRTGPPEARFSLLHVRDLADALVKLVVPTNTASQQAFELHDGKANGYDWTDLQELAQSVRNQPVRVLPVPGLLLHSMGWFNLLLARSTGTRPPPLVPGKVRELVHHDWVCDNSALPGCDNWQPSHLLTTALHQLPGWRDF